jgi:hypothetical protein
VVGYTYDGGANAVGKLTAQATVDSVTKSPGNYQVAGSSCVDFAERVVTNAGGKSPNDLKPSSLINDIRKEQYKDNSVQTH